MRDVLAEGLVASGIKVTPHKLDPRYYPAELLGLFEKNRFDVVIPTNLGIPFVYVPDLVSLTQKFGKGAGIVRDLGVGPGRFCRRSCENPQNGLPRGPGEDRGAGGKDPGIDGKEMSHAALQESAERNTTRTTGS